MIFRFEGKDWWIPVTKWTSDVVAELPDGRKVEVTQWLGGTPARLAVVSGEGKTAVKVVEPGFNLGLAPKAPAPAPDNIKKMGPFSITVSFETVITHTREALYAYLVSLYFPDKLWVAYTVKDYRLVGVVVDGKVILEVLFKPRKR